MNQWKELAKTLFFDEGNNVSQTAKMVGVSKQSVSKYFMREMKDQYKQVMEQRSEEKRIARVERERTRKRAWKQSHTQYTKEEEYKVLRRQHEIDTMVLSAEKI